MLFQSQKEVRGLQASRRIHAFAFKAFGPAVTAIMTLGLLPVQAANISLKTSDAQSTTSFTGSTNWSNGAAPSAGNNYFTGAFTLRTPNPTASGNNYVFGGDSLS